VTRIRAVVFDLFGTLVPEFPLSVWEGMLDGMATALGADRNAFRRAWAETVVERQTGGFPDVESNVREIVRRVGVEPRGEAIRRAIEIRERSYHTSFRPQPGAAVGMTPVRIVDPTATHPVPHPDVDDWLGAEA
jgi:putative hydrolase of the HAD superfamily